MEAGGGEAPAASVGRPAAKKSRLLWLDAAKGLGILLVVAGHGLGGFIDSPGGRQAAWARDIFLAIYVFHMPLFFFLSGLLVRPRLERGRTAFFLNLLATVVYPYFLWSTLQYGAIYAAGSLVNRPVALFWKPLLNLPFISISQFWFLYVLFFLHLAALVLVPRVGARAFFGIMVAGKLVMPLLALPVMPRLMLVHGAAYALGVLTGTGFLDAASRSLSAGARRMVVPLAALASLLIAAMTAYAIINLTPTFGALRSWQITGIAWRLPATPAAVAASAGVILMALALRGRIAEMLAYLGQRTMAIFVLHVLFIAGTRILLGKVVHGQPVLVLAATMAVGLFAPLLVHALVRRTSGSRIFGLG